MTTSKIIQGYRVLNAARLTKLKEEEKAVCIKAVRELKPIAASYDEYAKDAAERLKPDGFEAIEQKTRNGEKLEPSEEAEISRLNASLVKLLEEEGKKEHVLGYDRLEEEGMQRLIASNDFVVGDIMTLYDIIGK